MYFGNSDITVHIFRNFLDSNNQKTFSLVSKNIYRCTYRYLNLKQSLSFKHCFIRNCSNLRLCPVSSPISPFCRKHSFSKNKETCFSLIQVKGNHIKKVKQCMWGALYVQEKKVSKT